MPPRWYLPYALLSFGQGHWLPPAQQRVQRRDLLLLLPGSVTRRKATLLIALRVSTPALRLFARCRCELKLNQALCIVGV